MSPTDVASVPDRHERESNEAAAFDVRDSMRRLQAWADDHGLELDVVEFQSHSPRTADRRSRQYSDKAMEDKARAAKSAFLGRIRLLRGEPCLLGLVVWTHGPSAAAKGLLEMRARVTTRDTQEVLSESVTLSVAEVVEALGGPQGRKLQFMLNMACGAGQLDPEESPYWARILTDSGTLVASREVTIWGGEPSSPGVDEATRADDARDRREHQQYECSPDVDRASMDLIDEARALLGRLLGLPPEGPEELDHFWGRDVSRMPIRVGEGR